MGTLKTKVGVDELISFPKQVFFQIRFDSCTLVEALQLCDQAVASETPLTIGCVNAAKVVNMRRDSALRDAVLSSDLILADGAAVVWASQLLGRRLPQRVTGIDLFVGLLEQAAQHGRSIYLLGALPEVLERLVVEIENNYPGLTIAGHRHGYFTKFEEEAIADEIRRAQVDYLFLGIQSPNKEHFLARWGKQCGAKVCHGVGGSFDVLAGEVRRAPSSWQKLGLEWLYRLKQEPRRLWKRYLVTNTKFLLLLAREMVRRLVGRS